MQLTLNGFITCDKCRYGRNLGANDWGCRSEKRRAERLKMVNKGDYTCDYAAEKPEFRGIEEIAADIKFYEAKTELTEVEFKRLEALYMEYNYMVRGGF